MHQNVQDIRNKLDAVDANLTTSLTAQVVSRSRQDLACAAFGLSRAVRDITQQQIDLNMLDPAMLSRSHVFDDEDIAVLLESSLRVVALFVGLESLR